MTRPLALLLALNLSTWAADFTTGKLFDTQAFLPPVREVIVPARHGTPNWSFAGKDHGNVTFFSGGLENVQTTAVGALKFPLPIPHQPPSAVPAA